jgi:hypothetical protein
VPCDVRAVCNVYRLSHVVISASTGASSSQQPCRCVKAAPSEGTFGAWQWQQPMALAACAPQLQCWQCKRCPGSAQPAWAAICMLLRRLRSGCVCTRLQACARQAAACWQGLRHISSMAAGCAAAACSGLCYSAAGADQQDGVGVRSGNQQGQNRLLVVCCASHSCEGHPAPGVPAAAGFRICQHQR